MRLRHEFYLPNVNVGKADHRTLAGREADRIEFAVSGHVWTLRRLVQAGEEALPADTLLPESSDGGLRHLEFAPHSMLHVDADHIGPDAAADTAEDICWLLQLALGQTVTWTLRGERRDGKFTMRQMRSVRMPGESNPSGPVTNDGNGRLKSFLESAFPQYRQNPAWWRMTVDWFALSQESKIVEVSGLMCSMLLDRAAAMALDKESFKAQIADELDKKLKRDAPERVELVRELDALFRRVLTPGWETHRSEGYLNLIKGWNKAPSYKAKMEMLFAHYGLNPPSRDVLDHRDTLAHLGELEDYSQNLSKYRTEIIRAVVSLLLRMLGYRGPYSVPGIGLVQD